METRLPNLNYIINANNFQKIQDAISEVTRIALLTIDYKGTPVTKHSKCSDFCKIIRSSSNYSKLCEKCDSRGGLEAARLQQPYIYICHMGLIDFAVPIIIDGQYLGAVMAGQVLINDGYEKENLEHIGDDKFLKEVLFNQKEVKDAYNRISVMSFDRVKDVANMISLISNYIVEEAVLKIRLNEVNEKIFLIDTYKNLNNIVAMHDHKNDDENFNIDNNIKTDIKPDIMEQSQDRSLLHNNIILNSALEYIQNNYCETISLDEMASLCNISSSYFSKIFKKVVGDNFSNYINILRIRKAKELLETSNMPIINISIDLGYEDCGYFIKVFKKNVGVTPALYRKKYKMNTMKCL